MIDVTRMNGSLLTINNHLIEMVEETPDTVITLTTGKKIIVKESRQEVKNLVKLYEKEITCNRYSYNYRPRRMCGSRSIWYCFW